MDVRMCPNGHQVSLIEERCRVCGAQIEQLGAEWEAPPVRGQVGSNGGFFHIGIGVAICVVGTIGILAGKGESHAVQILGGFACFVGLIVLQIGVIAEAIKVSRGH